MIHVAQGKDAVILSAVFGILARVHDPGWT